MARGRQFYNPIIQVPDTIESPEDLSRIELFPVTEDTRIETAQPGKWMGRKIDQDGVVAELAPGDFDHDAALRQVQELWPGLTVFELRSEFEDSTWTGAGPSPRIWQSSPSETDAAAASLAAHHPSEPSSDLFESEAEGEQISLRILPLTEPGVYVLLEDIRMLLETWAVAYEIDKNPSAALALRDAVDMLKEVG